MMLAPIPPSEFSAIVARLVTRLSREEPAQGTRLMRAAAILAADEQPIVYWADGTATVRSERDAATTYAVTGQQCSCTDAHYRAQACKHVLAVQLHRRASTEYRAEQQRKRDYGATYQAPGTPFAFVACRACGTWDELSALGLCSICCAEPRYEITALGCAALGEEVA